MQAFTKLATFCSPASSSSSAPKWAAKANIRPDLPPTHTALLDREGRTFYLDHTTKSTSWTPPAGAPYTPGVPLPYEQLWDWQMERWYYVNHETNATSWEAPVGMDRKLHEKEKPVVSEIEKLGEEKPEWAHPPPGTQPKPLS